MNTSSRRNLIITLFIIFTLGLSGCSAPKSEISDTRIDDLKDYFIGREFVFSTDWTNQMVVYQGEPVLQCFATPHQRKKCLERAERKKKVLARAGTVAKITNVKSDSTWRIFIQYKTEQDTAGNIFLVTDHLENWAMHGPMAHAKWTDQNSTIPKIEELLTRSTIKFLDMAAETDEIPVTLTAPVDQPKLSPVETLQSNSPQVSEIQNLSADVEPSLVKQGDTIRLLLNYDLISAGDSPTAITELRDLLHNGQSLPGYPKQRSGQLTSSHQNSAFRQQIPTKAKPGTYTYKAEVCIETGCISKLINFMIEAR